MRTPPPVGQPGQQGRHDEYKQKRMGNAPVGNQILGRRHPERSHKINIGQTLRNCAQQKGPSAGLLANEYFTNTCSEYDMSKRIHNAKVVKKLQAASVKPQALMIGSCIRFLLQACCLQFHSPLFNKLRWLILPSFPEKDHYISKGEILPLSGEFRLPGTITNYFLLP
jgi:hypothetical protein